MCDVAQHVCPAAEPEPEPDASEEADPPYAAELATLSIKLLKRRAKALGATAEQIEDIYRVDDVKAAAIHLALSLLTALDAMNLADLRVRLRTMGATEEQLDDLDDEEEEGGQAQRGAGAAAGAHTPADR